MFQKTTRDVVSDDTIDKIKEVLIDVVNYCILMVDVYYLCFNEIIQEIIKRNNEEYTFLM